MIELNIVDHGAVGLHDIVPAIIVIVQKFHGYATHQDRFVTDAGAIGHIGEGAVPIVVVETIQFEVQMSDVHILPAIAVHVGGIDAHAGLIASVLTHGQAGDQ